MIIFLSGSINSGKSTVAKLLLEKLSNTALLEIDALREMINWMPIDQAIPINLENAISVIRNFTNHNLHVIIPYPLSQKNYDYVIDKLKNLATEIHVFTLAPKLEKAPTNRGGRELEESEKDRIKYHYEIGIHNPKFGEVIDNSSQDPKETVQIILESINETLPNTRK